MLVSVYIPSKNRPALLQRAINSVIEQSYKSIEIVVCIDGEDDYESISLLDEYIQQDVNLKYIVNAMQSGACVSRNNAISLCSGEFITGLDDDDIMANNRIQLFIDNWDSRYAFISSQSIRLNSGYSFLYKFLSNDTVFTDKKMMSFNYAGNQIFAHRSTFEKFKFDEELPALQDWELWFRILKETDKPAKRIGERTQIMDVSHGEVRISNFSRREEALIYICNKHTLELLDFRRMITLWKLEFSVEVDLLSIFDSLFSSNFIPTFRNLILKLVK